MLNGTEYAQYQKEWIEDNIRFTQNRAPTEADIPLYLRNPSQYGEGTNWYNEILQTAPQSSINASVSGEVRIPGIPFQLVITTRMEW